MLQMTHLGGPTVLIQLGGWRILTDPTFDDPGHAYAFGWGTGSTKTAGPALPAEAVMPVDVVLLSHDHHADNLDERGRALMPDAGTVLTTQAGARRLRGVHAVGMAPGTTHTLSAPGRETLTIRATPCRHGPPLSGPVVGQVIGFAVTLGDREPVTVWMTGDTVLHRPLRRLAQRLDVDVLLVHLGRVRFPLTGRVRYSMDGRDALRLVELLGPRVVVPVHYEGWSHFSEPAGALRSTLAGDPATARLIAWLEPGVATPLATTAGSGPELQ